VASLFIATLVLVTLSAGASPGVTQRVSVGSGGQANLHSYVADVSDDGRFVVFDSYATNLVPGDANSAPDVFVYDRQTGVAELVSVSSAGVQGNSYSISPSISDDGRFVAFYSFASNLVAGDTNAEGDIFVRDRQAGTTQRVSVDSAGNQANEVTFPPTISGDGRFVAFESWATNFVPDDTNHFGDAFIYDRLTGIIEQISVNDAGVQGNFESEGPAPSADGRFVAIYSWASTLVEEDTNGAYDIFVRDRQAGTTERVSVDSAGNEANGNSYDAAISADGRFVAFASSATNLAEGDSNGKDDVFVHDRQTGATEMVSLASAGAPANGHSGQYRVAMSGDGRYVVFRSEASNLIGGDGNGYADIFVHDRQTGDTAIVSVDGACGLGNSSSSYPGISAGGHLAVFTSWASDLVGGDSNSASDIFVYDLGEGVDGLCQGDGDGDGIPDNVEDDYPCLDPDADDGGADADGDTLASLSEWSMGTDPCLADSDGDGFDDGAELYVGTDPLSTCPDPDGEPDAWPPDYDKSRTVDVFDVIALKEHFNAAMPDPRYEPRLDLGGQDGKINLTDALQYKPYWQGSCSP
jgi:Tol biopolymer transport system component